MSAVVAILPTTRAIEQAWEDYTQLVRMQAARPELGVDQEHQIAMLRAHRRWADLFNAMDRQA